MAGVNKILKLMREQGIRSISEQQYVSKGEINTMYGTKRKFNDHNQLDAFDWLDDRVDQVIGWGRET